MSLLQVGSQAPLFELEDQNGTLYRLDESLGKKNLVIYFYPKDETRGCTAEACTFRDEYEVFLTHDAEVIGISGDSRDSHLSFARRHSLPFVLLSDPSNRIREMFGVPPSFFGLIPGRTTFIIDKQGVIQHIFTSQLSTRKHVKVALEVLKKLTNH